MTHSYFSFSYPYNFTIDGVGPTPLICDDFSDEIYLNESWQADVFDIFNVADAGNGQMTPVSGSLGYNASALDHGRKKAYQQAAYLYKRLTMTPDYSREDAVLINHTIWALFANTGFNPSSSISSSFGSKSMADMLNEADINTNNLTDQQLQAQLGNIRFYTPVCSDTGNPQCVTQPQYSSRPQEFIGTVPEPSAFVLLGTGLLGLGAITRRKRS